VEARNDSDSFLVKLTKDFDGKMKIHRNSTSGSFCRNDVIAMDLAYSIVIRCVRSPSRRHMNGHRDLHLGGCLGAGLLVVKEN
jgi:hypothetical protein